MRNLIFLGLALVACGGSGPGDDVQLPDGAVADGSSGVDARGDAAVTVCDPAEQTGCPTGRACYTDGYSTGGMDFSTVCAVPGPGTETVACTSDAGCAAGFWCADDPQSGTHSCAQFCDATHGCPSDSPVCTGMDGSHLSYGYCSCTHMPYIGGC